jgi:hypothetical protein
MSHYAVLGLQRDFTHEQLKKQYRLLALRYHPDRNRGDEEAAADQFKRVQEAYGTLADPSKRAAYDLVQRRAAQARQGRPPDGMTRRAAAPASGTARGRAGESQWSGDRDPASTMDDIFRAFAAGGMFGGGLGGGPAQAARPAADGLQGACRTGRGGSGCAGNERAFYSGGPHPAYAPTAAARGTPPREQGPREPPREQGVRVDRSPRGIADEGIRVHWWQVMRERAATAAAVAIAMAADATTAPPAAAAAQSAYASDEADLSEDEPTKSRVEDRGGNGPREGRRLDGLGPVAARRRRVRSRSVGRQAEEEWDGLEEALAASAADAHVEQPARNCAAAEAAAREAAAAEAAATEASAAEAAAREASEIDEAVSASCPHHPVTRWPHPNFPQRLISPIRCGCWRESRRPTPFHRFGWSRRPSGASSRRRWSWCRQ